MINSRPANGTERKGRETLFWSAADSETRGELKLRYCSAESLQREANESAQLYAYAAYLISQLGWVGVGVEEPAKSKGGGTMVEAGRR